MTINEMFDELENKMRDTYIVTLKYKYDFEKNYTVENHILEYDCMSDSYVWLNDWNEGQTDVEVVGYILLDDVDTTKLLTCEDCVSRESLDNAISDLTYWHFENDRLITGGGGSKAETVYKVDDVWRLTHVLPSVTPSYNSIKTELKPYDTPRTNLAETSQDCISREEVRKLICQNNDAYGYSDRFHEFTEKCLQLPSVTSQRPKGHWIHNNCSICGYSVNPWNNTLYCPNCGADMRDENSEVQDDK